MLSLYKIWTVARYEMKTLLRSWFFRIFSILAIIILILLNVGLHTKLGRNPWFLNGLNASLPYMNILLINVVQAIIGVFLASDFLKRDKKLDTTEVVYMRSMTNGDYVLGKTLGILLVFLALNVIVLITSAIFHIFFSEASFTFAPYLLYPLVISLPTLLFIFGLSFLFMVIIRNQAVTLIILLGYIAVTLFYLSKKFYHLFDYLAFNVPMMYSDFIGFGDLGTIFLHRGIYFLLGLAFIFATIFMIKRLPQSNVMTKFSIIFAFICLGASLFLGYLYIMNFSAAANFRQEIKELAKKYMDEPVVKPIRYDLTLEHSGGEISVKGKLKFQNNTDENIDRYIFSLNPGLTVKSIRAGEMDLKFQQDRNLLLITPQRSLAPDALDSITIEYSGKIDERATYFDADEGERQKMFRVWLYNVAKKTAIIRANYVLITPEANWYPSPGLPTSLTFPEHENKNFFEFNLSVKTKKGLTPITQGKLVEKEGGNYVFRSDRPLCQRSLVIGDYAVKSITVDSIDYRLYYYQSHDYFSPYFTDINDTLAALIREVKQDYENAIGLEYKFPRFSLVEVPIQFFYYPHVWSVGTEVIQPEMALVHEKGVLMNGADIHNQLRWQERWMRRRNQTTTPEERQSNIFKDFLRSGLLNSGFRRMFFAEGLMGLIPDYHIFPNYFTFVHDFYSPKVPLFHIAFESYLSNKTSPPVSGFRRMFRGMTDEEKANIALTEQSLEEIFNDPDKQDILPSVLNLKGQYLFKYLQNQIGDGEFEKFISDYLKNHYFQKVDVQQFADDLEKITSFNLMPFFETWYQSKDLAAYLVTNVTAYKIIDNDRTRYQVKFNIENANDTEGLISVIFRMAGRRGRFFGMGPGAEQPEEKLFRLGPREIKQIGIVLDEEPRIMTINTLISQNIPATITQRFEDLELNEKAVPFEGERQLAEHLKWIEPDEIVVDNEDDGFSIVSPESKSFLQKLFSQNREAGDEKYTGIHFWRPPKKWRLTTSNDFFGKFVHSAYYVKSGSGNSRAVWKTQIQKSGEYDVYYYGSSLRLPWRRDRKRKNEFTQDFHFTIYHDDGTEEMIIDMSDVDPGWILLGSYYISQGEAKVELSNKSKGKIVFADAVKWVKK